MYALLEVELDVDRVARVTIVPGEMLRVVVLEDMHYPLEPERRRQARPEELAAVEGLISRGKFRTLETGKDQAASAAC